MNHVSLVHRIEHLTRMSDLRRQSFFEILELAEMMKDEPTHGDDVLRGRAIACISERRSAQARVITGAAAARLGATTIPLAPRDIDLGCEERTADGARSLSGHVAAVVVAGSAQRWVDALAHSSTVPVINAQSDTHAPCQVLADLLTIKEAFGDLADRRLAFLGDGGSSIARSLIEGCALAGMNLTIASPPDYGPDAELLTQVRQQLEETGVELQVIHDPRAAVAGAHAVYADAWASTRDGSEHRAGALRAFQVTEELMSLAQPGAVFLHCLPATRGVEVAAGVIDGPQSVVWAQSANRLPVEEAVLMLLLRGVES